MSIPVKKYRPVLTGGMIEHILSLCKKETPISSESISVIGVLAPFQAKIQNDAIAEAYTVAPPKPSLEESLGLEVPATTPSSSTPPRVSKEEYWHLCHTKYTLSPESCTLTEIQAAREHAYLHELMSPEEVEAFEREHLPAALQKQAD